MKISERVIEDVLTTDKTILAGILKTNVHDLTFLARQKVLNSGKLDMLFLHQDELILIELKVVNFYSEIIDQLNGYYEDLVTLQSQNKIIKCPIRKIVFTISHSSRDEVLCKSNSIDIIDYKPEEVLSSYYNNFKELSHFLTIQPADYGMVRLGLLKPTLRLIGKGIKLTDIATDENRSIKTVRNKISVAMQLNLIVKHKEKFYLTDIGENFNTLGTEVDDQLNGEQTSLLQTYVKDNPFYSSITYSILGLVESVFTLSKNQHPVPQELVKEHFVKSVGKISTWSREKSKTTATYIFSNYAVELEFLTKVNNNLFLTPLGINAILLLQLHRSIKLIEQKDKYYD